MPKRVGDKRSRKERDRLSSDDDRDEEVLEDFGGSDDEAGVAGGAATKKGASKKKGGYDSEDSEGEDLYDQDKHAGDGIGLYLDQSSEDDGEDDDLDSFINDGTPSEASQAEMQHLNDLNDLLDSPPQGGERRHQKGVFDDDSEDGLDAFGDAGDSSDPSDSDDGEGGRGEDEDDEEAEEEGGEGGGGVDNTYHITDAADGVFDPGFDWTRAEAGDLADWLSRENPRKAVKNRIFNFYYNFCIGTRRIYKEKLAAMVRENGASFEVNFMHLLRMYKGTFAEWFLDAPELMFEIFNEVANHWVFSVEYKNYKSIQKTVRVRLGGLPTVDPIRDFRQSHRGVLVRVEGVVTRRSPVYPRLQAVRYDCGKCHFVIGPVMQRGEKEIRVTQCPSCHSNGPFKVNSALTEYENYQTLVLQEPPGKVPPGRLPRSLEVHLTNDTIDKAKPGEEVDVVGIYKNTFDASTNAKQGFPVFTTILLANNIHRKSADMTKSRIPEEEKERIMRLARSPNLKKKMVASMAPSIHGRDDIKLALLLSLLAGVPKDIAGDQSHKIRGDINVLLVGDPGTAKSQFLKFIEKTADRAVFTTGRGSSAVGLTASVHKDPVSGEFTLEGGALVIADRGVCLIDEFDKMSDVDRTSIHEAMEQQTISVARGGVVTTLSARATIMAAANPIGGRYDPSISFDANVDLTTPILSRFDLLFVVRDEVNPELDRKLAEFVCMSHMRSHPKAQDDAARKERTFKSRLLELRVKLERLHARLRLYQQQQMGIVPGTQTQDAAASGAGGEGQMLEDPSEEIFAVEAERDEVMASHQGSTEVKEDDDPNSGRPLPQALLKNYIQYAKATCRPLLININAAPLVSLYAELRQQSKQGGIAITVRHMESIIRLAEAHAKLHLREYVTDEDITCAMALFLRSYLGAQKYSVRNQLEHKFAKYLDSDVEPEQLLHHKLAQMIRTARAFERQLSGGIEPTTVKIDCLDLRAMTDALKVTAESVDQYLRSEMFSKQYGLELDPQSGVPRRIVHTILG